MPDVQQLLALANGAALHKALLKAGYTGAKYRTVARWVQQRQAPAEMEQAILAAFGLGQTETPPPWWAEASSALVGQVEERMRAIAESAVTQQQAGLLAEVADEIEAALRSVQQPSGADDPADTQAPAGTARKARRRSR